MPKEEDFTFILTALWNWHYENPIPKLDLIRDAAEITQEVAPLPKQSFIEIFESKKPRTNSEEHKKKDLKEGDKKEEIDAAYLKELVKKEGSILKAKEALKRRLNAKNDKIDAIVVDSANKNFALWGKE